MRHTILFAIASTVFGNLEAQGRIPSPDTLRAQAALLAGCYRFAYRDSIPALPSRLPTKLELRQLWFRKLGYHRLGFFEVRPAQLQRSAYVAWRPLGRDSLQIELMATPTSSPEDVTLSGTLGSDTLTGVVTEWTAARDSGHGLPTYRTVTVGHFKAARTRCP